MHQLRGRVARHGGNGYFFMLVKDDLSADAMQRLSMMLEYEDGFALAEKDLELRGFGDLSKDAVKQHGVVANLMFSNIKLSPRDFAS